MNKLKSWWEKGGTYIGNDTEGEPMFSLTNGDRVMFIGTLSACVVIFVFICVKLLM